MSKEPQTPANEDAPMPRLTMTIVSNVDPLSFRFDETQAKDGLLEARWQSVLGHFQVMHVEGALGSREDEGNDKEKRVSSSDRPANRKEFLEQECVGNPVLEKCQTMLLQRADDQGSANQRWCAEAERRNLLEIARGYYEEIWQSLTMDERLALFHLARDRFIHVEHPGLDPLFRKGLIRFDPDIRVMNTSFREFVCRVGDRDELSAYEAQQGHSPWKALKGPVTMGGILILTMLLLTQEELRTALPAVASIVPLLFQGWSGTTKGKEQLS